MNREIKFRAWDKENKEMKGVHVLGQRFVVAVDETEELNLPIERVELMQYTGLKDKNGTPIFESDILSVFDIKEPMIDVVTFNGLAWKHGEYNLLIDCVDWDLEVIGNVFENPELLEGRNL